jgi:hypothetical protein
MYLGSFGLGGWNGGFFLFRGFLDISSDSARALIRGGSEGGSMLENRDGS